jgi:hypothetical protein
MEVRFKAYSRPQSEEKGVASGFIRKLCNAILPIIHFPEVMAKTAYSRSVDCMNDRSRALGNGARGIHIRADRTQPLNAGRGGPGLFHPLPS